MYNTWATFVMVAVFFESVFCTSANRDCSLYALLADTPIPPTPFRPKVQMIPGISLETFGFWFRYANGAKIEHTLNLQSCIELANLWIERTTVGWTCDFLGLAFGLNSY